MVASDRSYGTARECDVPSIPHAARRIPHTKGRGDQRRNLGRTGLRVSVLGYGAGAVGGLMTKE